ncbi:MAG TPA: Yip1 family protein [Usitatibacter sp.]|nr:Yip1 family protein [Usitatibacter sp.]
MGLIDRAKNILLSPKAEWEAIAAQTTPDAQVIVGYVLPLAVVAALAGFIGVCLVGVSAPFVGTFRMGIGWGLATAVYQLVMAVIMVYVMAFIIDALAPTFGAQKGLSQALKVSVYAYTPVWVVSIVKIIPMLGVLVLLAALYAIYLLYLGLQRVMKAPKEKAAGYTAVVVIAGIVIAIVIGVISGLAFRAGMPGFGGGFHAGGGPGPNVTFAPNSPMGRLNEFGKKMEEANKQMEAAQQSGDKNKQMEAALGAVGTAISGGKGVEPLQIDQLKAFVPEKFAGMPRTDLRAERNGVKGLMMAKAEATYSNGPHAVVLEVTDTGGMAALAGLAAWAGLEGEHEDSQKREVIRREGDLMVREKVDKHGGTNEYSVMAGDRFIVSAKGVGVDVGVLKSGVAEVDLAKLQSTK